MSDKSIIIILVASSLFLSSSISLVFGIAYYNYKKDDQSDENDEESSDKYKNPLNRFFRNIDDLFNIE